MAAPAAAAPSSDWAAFPQQGAPQPQVAAVTQQFSNMQMAPGGAGLTDVFAPSAPAQPAAQAHMPPQQQQPANSQDQKVDFMKNALASLYQQPAQPADPFAAAFSATAPSNMGMGGQMCGAPAMMQQGYGGMAQQGYGGYGQPQQQMPMAPQQGMGGMGGMMQQGMGMQQPAMMQQANSYQGGMANGMQMGMQSGMGMSMPSGMPAGMPAGAGMSMPSGMPGMGMSMPSGAPVPQQQAALPGTHADAMKHVLDGFSLGGNQAHSSTSTSGLPSPGSVNIPPAPSSLDIDAFSAFGQTAQQPSGMAAAGMPMQQPMMGGQMGGMNMGMQQPMMGGMQPQQQMGMQQQPMMQQQMGGMQQQGGGMQQQMGGMPQMGMQQQMMGGAPQQVW